IIPVVAATCRLFQRRPAIQHALWTVILLKFITPTIVTWPWSMLDVLDSASVLAPNWSDDAANQSDIAQRPLRKAGPTGSMHVMYGWMRTGEASRLAGGLATSFIFVWFVGATVYASRQIVRIWNQRMMVMKGVAPSARLSVDVN